GITTGLGTFFGQKRKRPGGPSAEMFNRSGWKPTTFESKSSVSALPFFCEFTGSTNPSAADYHVAIVENHGLSRGDGALRGVEGDEDFVVAGLLDNRRRGFVTMANLGVHANRLPKVFDGNPVHLLGAQGAREQFVSGSDHDLTLVAPTF